MLAPFLDRLSDEELDVVPYGIIQLNAEGRVLSINRLEAEGLEWPYERPVGRDYFNELAPSAFGVEVFGRYVEAFSAHHLDETFRFTFSHGTTPRTVMMRMYYAVRTGTMWIFTANPDGSPLATGDRRACDVRDAPHALMG